MLTSFPPKVKYHLLLLLFPRSSGANNWEVSLLVIFFVLLLPSLFAILISLIDLLILKLIYQTTILLLDRPIDKLLFVKLITRIICSLSCFSNLI